MRGEVTLIRGYSGLMKQNIDIEDIKIIEKKNEK
jgi:hypothetical protein